MTELAKWPNSVKNVNFGVDSGRHNYITNIPGIYTFILEIFLPGHHMYPRHQKERTLTYPCLYMDMGEGKRSSYNRGFIQI